jgi:signal transduction histidine kinase
MSVAPPLDQPGLIDRWAWLPAPLLLLASLLVWSYAPETTFSARELTLILQFVFMTLASWITAYFLIRSFLATGAPGLLFIGGGIVLWGLSGVVSGALGRSDANATVSIHNLCIWVSSASQLFGTLLSSAPRRLKQRGTWALGVFIAVMVLITLIGAAVTSGATPVFFIEGSGGTQVRQTVLGSAVAMLLLSTAVLSSARADPGRFTHWYRLCLLLMAVGVFSIALSAARNSVASWIGLVALWLSGVYLVAAATAAAREAKAHQISLALAPRDARLRYGLALVFIGAAWAIRLLFFDELGTAVPYILFFPAVMLAALYGGPGPSILAATLSILVANYFWSIPPRTFDFSDPVQWTAALLFYGDCLLLILVARAVQQARDRVAVAEAERRFAQRAEQGLRDADRRKDAFLATLSHEIRNALAPISNSLEIIQRAPPGSGTTDAAQLSVRQQVAHLNRIVDDLLDVSRITRDKLELRTAPTDVASIINLSLEACHPLASRAGHTIRLTLPTRPITVEADSMRLVQVFTNLLNNACKYTEAAGRIDVEVTEEAGEAVIAIRDNGIGIAPDMLPIIFEPFTQVDQSIARSQGGLGIGLSLARRLVEMHSGELTGHSDGLGRGSRFVVRLPATADAPAVETAPLPAAAHAASVRRILVADDNRDSADSFAKLFQLTGNEVETAYDGMEAIVAAERFRPHVALLDIGMPKVDGYEVCRRIREQPWGKDIVLIAHTGWGESRQVNEAGFDGYLTKPVDYAALTNLLDSLPARRAA